VKHVATLHEIVLINVIHLWMASMHAKTCGW